MLEQDKTANPGKPCGEIDISRCSTKEEKVNNRLFCFCIITVRSNIYLEASTKEERLGWLSSIDEVKMVISNSFRYLSKRK